MTQEIAEQVSSLAVQFGDASKRAATLVRSAGSDRLTARPASGGWSAVECLIHLNKTSKLYIPLIHSSLRQARAEGLEAVRRFRMDWRGRSLAWFLEPPYRLKGKTIPGALPDRIRPPEAALEEFQALNSQLVSQLEEGGRLAMDEILISSPFSGSTTYNLYSAFIVIAAHERRHLWQAERTLESLS
jgi:hypothetical protein